MTEGIKNESFEAINVPLIRQKKNEFLKEVAKYRPDLFRFCRRLTNNPWDAEDLAQETMLIAYGRLADKHAGIHNVRSYLFKMASNQWLSWCRRSQMQMDFWPMTTEPMYQDDLIVVKDSLGTLLNHLPPKERVAFVLSEVFDSKNEEIAEIIGNTEGAVKSALARAKEKLKHLNTSPPISKEKPTQTESSKVLDLAIQAFNARDIEAFAKLFATNAIGNAPGCFFETGAEEIKKGSLFYTIHNHDGTPQPPNIRAEKISYFGEQLFVLFDGNTIDDIWRLAIEDQEILRFDCYYCCPDVLTEIAHSMNKNVNTHGYWFEQNKMDH